MSETESGANGAQDTPAESAAEATAETTVESAPEASTEAEPEATTEAEPGASPQPAPGTAAGAAQAQSPEPAGQKSEPSRASAADPAAGESEAQRAQRLIRKHVVGIGFHLGDAPRYFDSIGLELEPGDRILVETHRGPQIALVLVRPRERQVDARRLRRVIRRISDLDHYRATQHAQEQEAYEYCAQRIQALELPMKLVRAEQGAAASRCTFYFSSEERVDFRGLVRDLARRLRMRIEMRQIGVRDQAKMVGGIGVCGRELCCASWISRFAPVSIRMAKDQGLALNPQKVSGVCGRLLCCLTYEQEAYRELRKGLPKVGKRINTPQGEGKVRDVDVLHGRVRVQLDSGMHEFTREQLDPASGQAASAQPQPQQRRQGPARPGADRSALDRGRPPADRGSPPADRGRPQRPTEVTPSDAQAQTEGGDAAKPAPQRRSRRRRRRSGGQGQPAGGPAQPAGASTAPAQQANPASPSSQGSAASDEAAPAEGGPARRRPRRRRRRRKKGPPPGDSGPATT